ncbi:hypothetical protein E3O19_02635 [Cryobacterium algoritolerans]|uniref:Lipoprotein LpqB N-terminal domain-containing protein n=1 Tax=Cryobacterium algoritolerans TaxID=1259184 RepID=A0A4R8WWH4_9MICO|nr:hypothetical protein [Cryobacterium algoritolerans]TFC19545.1 hypothetical protein E3O19_02635 [Cryobacterium algoritolerans]
MSATQRKPDRSLILILGVIAALVIVALAVVFTRGEPAPLDPGTPAGVVQLYSAAVLAGDEQTAAGYLIAGRLDTCDKVDPGPLDGIRLSLASTTVRENSAAVTVSIVTSTDNGPFGASEYENEDVFDLVRVDGRWRIDGAPWQLSICPNPTATS